MTRIVLPALSAILLGACGVTPSHDIKPKPDHIMVGVQAGDKLEIITKDGDEVQLTVSEVTATSIKSADHDIAFGDIEKITKRSWSEPAHPCGAGEPVGCSVPGVLIVLSDDLENQFRKFKKPCIAHDFCYRHGNATYGLQQAECDGTFYDDMRAACHAADPFGVLDPKELAICELAANRAYEAVREHGGEAFRTTTSTYCEYL